MILRKRRVKHQNASLPYLLSTITRLLIPSMAPLKFPIYNPLAGTQCSQKEKRSWLMLCSRLLFLLLWPPRAWGSETPCFACPHEWGSDKESTMSSMNHDRTHLPCAKKNPTFSDWLGNVGKKIRTIRLYALFRIIPTTNKVPYNMNSYQGKQYVLRSGITIAKNSSDDRYDSLRGLD